MANNFLFTAVENITGSTRMETRHKPLKELAKLFFKLGCIGFGGPVVHIAMMEREVVSKRKWFSSGHFLDMVSATNLIPGPNSTEMTMHIGHERAGWKGLLVSGICFIFPAVLIRLPLPGLTSTMENYPRLLPLSMVSSLPLYPLLFLR